MLFPVYWMVTSRSRGPRNAQGPPNWFPVDATLDGYRAVMHQQMPYLGASLLIGLGTVR